MLSSLTFLPTALKFLGRHWASVGLALALLASTLQVNHVKAALRHETASLGAASLRATTAEYRLSNLAVLSAQREAVAKAAQVTAEVTAKQAYATARLIISAKPSNPSDLCASARTLVDQQIAKDSQ